MTKTKDPDLLRGSNSHWRPGQTLTVMHGSGTKTTWAGVRAKGMVMNFDQPTQKIGDNRVERASPIETSAGGSPVGSRATARLEGTSLHSNLTLALYLSRFLSFLLYFVSFSKNS